MCNTPQKGQSLSLRHTQQEKHMTTRELRKIASEMGRPTIIKALRKKAAQMSKEKGKERATELVEEWIALTEK